MNSTEFSKYLIINVFLGIGIVIGIIISELVSNGYFGLAKFIVGTYLVISVILGTIIFIKMLREKKSGINGWVKK